MLGVTPLRKHLYFKMIGVDLFSGAGGMTLGAKLAAHAWLAFTAR
jgi:hypothetical protein